MIHSVLHAIAVFFHHLAAVEWKWLALGILCQLAKLGAVSRAWRNIIKAAYPDRPVRWRQIYGAYVAGTGINALIPARSGDVVRLFLAKRRIDDATYTTLVSKFSMRGAWIGDDWGTPNVSGAVPFIQRNEWHATFTGIAGAVNPPAA